jgi:hypothetical protein
MSHIDEYYHNIGENHSEKGASRVCIDRHRECPEEDHSRDKVPILLLPHIVGEEPTEKYKICTHGIRIIEDSLKPSSIGSFDSMKNRRNTITLMPSRRISTISSIEEEIFAEWVFEESTDEEHNS